MPKFLLIFLAKFFANHPKQLPLLFTVEAFERFAYYAMRSILVLYMSKFLFLDLGEDATRFSNSLYGWFTGLVYLSPVFGGLIADRLIGKRASVIIGAILMGLGYFTIAMPYVSFFYVALGLIILGNGFFKPNITPMVSELYPDKDTTGKQGGMTIFYMGINLGALFSPLIAGTLGENYGWHWGFIAAGVGMFIALGIFLWGQKTLGHIGRRKPSITATSVTEKRNLTREEKQQMAVIGILSFFVIFFWVAFEQAGSSLTLFADRSVDRMIFGLEFPASWFQSINPLFIVLLGLPMTRLWKWLSDRGKEPSAPMKMTYGLFLASIGFLIMIPAAMLASGGSKVMMLWLIGVYFTHTVGELCLSPIGLATVTELAPKRFVSMMIGVWFVANFAANWLAGQFASLYETMALTTFFWVPVITAGVAGLILLCLVNPLKKWGHGKL